MRSMNTALVALAALCWGIAGGIGAVLLEQDWGPFLIAFYRGGIGLLFVLAWLALRPHHSGLTDRRLWFWSLIAGLGVAGNLSFYFVSIGEGSIAIAATLMYCAPVFVYLVSFAFGIERPTALKWTAILVVMIGIALLTGIHDVNASQVTPIALGAGLLSGLCYAGFIFGFRYASPHGSPQAILVIAFAVLVAVLAGPADNARIVAVLRAPDWPLFLALGILGAGLSFVFYVLGLKYTAPAVASIVAMIEPVTASLFGVLIMGDRLGSLQILGMGLILITATLMSVYSTNRWPHFVGRSR